MKAIFLSHSDSGGAGRAAIRTFLSLRDYLNESEFLVNESHTDVPSFLRKKSLYARTSNKALTYLQGEFLSNLIGSPSRDVFNLNFFDMQRVDTRHINSFDVVQLFWICNFISISQLKNINKGVVWRFSDLWPLTYGYHYDDALVNADNWSEYYKRLSTTKRIFIDYKISNFPKNLYIVCPSQWMYRLVTSCDRFDGSRVVYIPTGVDTKIFSPIEKSAARDFLDLDLGDKVLLVGSVGGDADPRKGLSRYRGIFSSLKREVPNLKIIGFGKTSYNDSLIRWIGRVDSDLFMRIIFSAADIYLSLSRVDNLPQTVIEAQACGCPVVAFASTGAGEAVQHGKTGKLLKGPETDLDIANTIFDMINDSPMLKSYSHFSRQRAIEKYDISDYKEKFLTLYRSAAVG